MSRIIEIIPADFPEWAQNAFDEGQFFRIAVEKVSLLEAENKKLKEQIASDI